MTSPKYISAAELARRWGFSRQWIHKLIKRGKVPSTQFEKRGTHLISLEWIEKEEALKNSQKGRNVDEVSTL